MKLRLSLFSIFIIVLTPCYGQEDTVKTFYQDGTPKLRQVFNKKDQLLEDTRFNTYGKLYSRQLNSYNKGLLIQEEYFNYNGPEFKLCYEYNRKKQISKKYSYNAKDSLTGIYTYRYDDRGNKIGEKSFFPPGTLNYQKTYTYDNRNNMIESAGYHPDGSRSSMNRYIYDSLNRCIEERSYSGADDHLTEIIKYAYDASDKLIWERFFGPDDTIFSSELRYAYTDQGLIAVKEWRNPGGLIERTINKYNDAGILIEETVQEGEKVKSIITFNDDGIEKSENLFYRYRDDDALLRLYNNKGNLVEEYDYFSKDSLDYEKTNVFDSIGQCIKTSKYWSSGSKSIWDYTYDTLGRMIKRTLHGKCDQLFTETVFRYDELGKKTGTWKHYYDGFLSRTSVYYGDKLIREMRYRQGFLGSDERYDLSGRRTLDMYYNQGVLRYKATYQYLDDHFEMTEYRYTENGILNSEETTNKEYEE